MRTSTFFLSFVVHAAVIATAVVVPLVATDVLPRPSQSLAFVAAPPDVPVVPPPAPQRRQAPADAARVNPDAAPLSEPADIQPEPDRLPFDLPAGDDVIVGDPSSGIGIGDVIAPPPPQAPPAPAPRQPVRIGGAIRAPQKTHHVAPAYPALALSARVTGTVILEAVVAEDGTVRDVRILRSIPLLDASAVDAVRQWRFTPSLLNGVPVPVIMTVTVAFNLK